MFNDDDLKRLQGYVNGELELEIGPKELAPLLARLAAAEKVCIHILGVEDMIKIPLVLGDDSRERAMKRLNAAYNEWRKEAGRA